MHERAEKEDWVRDHTIQVGNVASGLESFRSEANDGLAALVYAASRRQVVR